MKISQKAKIAIYLGLMCSVSYFAVYLARNILSPITNSLLADGFTEAQVGLISSAYLICYACGQLINGFIGHKVPAKYMLAIGLLMAGVMNLLFPFLSYNRITAIVLYACMGFFLSMIYSPMVKVVAESVEPIYAPRCSLGYTFASLVATPGASFLAAVLTWQSVYYSTSAILIFMAILSFSVFSLFEKRGFVNSQKHTVSTDKVKGSGAKVLIKRGIIVFSIVSIITGIIRTTVVFWIPTYISQQLGFSAKNAATVNIAVTLVICLCTFFAVFMYERLKRNLSLSVLLSFISSSVLFALVLIVKQPILNIIFLTLAVFSNNCADSLMWAVYCPGLRDTGMTSIAVGYLDFLSYAAAAASNVIFSNAVADIGWQPLIAIWTALMCVGIIACLPWTKIIKRSPADTEENNDEEVVVNE